MPPPLPRNPIERHEMWGRAHANAGPFHVGNIMDLGDPMEPADHLDETTRHRTSLFPDMTNFLRSRFGLSRVSESQWFPVRPLGGVALWERRNSVGDVVEETAVKQSKWNRSMALARQPHLAKEAAIMIQLNKMCSEHIVYLKGFKCFSEEAKGRATWRFYFEYCPYGDLSYLETRYKAWGCVQNILHAHILC